MPRRARISLPGVSVHLSKTWSVPYCVTACGGTDCSEIASKLLNAAGGKGKVIEVRPKQPGNLTLFENGAKEPGQFYHQVYTDGRYVYDPRLSSNPIPKGDWEQHIKGMNPDGVTISDKLRGL